MGRTPCCDKNGLKKGPWTPEEDQKLIDYVQTNGDGNWRTLPKNAGLQRCGKSCRLRWTNYLRPDIKRGRFSFEEEETIIHLHSMLGNKWSAIAARLPGRTDNEIKNYWNTHIRKRLLRMGIDPVTHSPRLHLLDISTILRNSPTYHPSSSSHMNFSRLLGLQPLITPQLIRLATSLLSTHRQSQDFLFPPARAQNQVLPVPAPSNAQVHDHDTMQHGAVEQLPQVLSGYFGSDKDILDINDWQQQSNGALLTESYEPILRNLDQFLMDSSNPMETPAFHSGDDNSFSLQSVLSNISTPSSSPAQLNSNSNSNSNYIHSSSGTDQDEKESDCSNMLAFELPDIFSDFM